MAVVTTGVPFGALKRAETAAVAKTYRQRHISAEAGHALEILGHAIEYLTDEYVLETGQISAHDPQLQAVQIMMELNRQIYYACPVEPTFTERLLAAFHIPSH